MGRRRDNWRENPLLAAALLQIPFEWADGSVGPIMDHNTAKQCTAEFIISLFQKDHDPIKKVDGGTEEHHNITWRPIMNHRHKTATKDVPELRKGERLAKSHEEFRRNMLRRAGQETDGPGISERPKFKRKWASRPMRSQRRRVRQ